MKEATPIALISISPTENIIVENSKKIQL